MLLLALGLFCVSLAMLIRAFNLLREIRSLLKRGGRSALGEMFPDKEDLLTREGNVIYPLWWRGEENQLRDRNFFLDSNQDRA
jgi:hypothetical protein